MASKKEYEEKTEKLLKSIVSKWNIVIYDVEYVKEASDYYLRAYIDKDGGVTIDDCENVSRALSDALDQADYINDAYILEVSSPGLGRTLKKDRHFQYCLNKMVDLKLFEAVEGVKEYSGMLTAFDKQSITIVMENGEKKDFDRSKISTVKLTLDF